VSRVAAPVIVIGAARSGTKLLRDLIASHPRFRAVPYDVNYVWRMGTETVPHDERDPADATPRVTARIRGQLGRFAAPGTTLVEKTVSNTLRVGFVHRILPDARFVHLLRDGRDVIASAYAQWQAPVDWRYTLAKLRQYPLLSAPGYALRWGVARLFGRGSRLPPVWGPAYRGIHEDLRALPLLQVCARQWQRSVEASLAQLAAVPPERVLTVPYARLVGDPDAELARIFRFLDADPAARAGGGPCVSGGYVGSFASRLSDRERADLERWVGPTLERVARAGVPPRP
jgi:hypothetical protein